ncbi:hypothetical protein AXX17_AT5G52220 [Arabidopsis thaliana]|uniref:SMP domain-containing protein n=4 Tax=Arabidopsis TaxID=3701 RepID=A0A178UPW7_ARATH|nr:hypothetical protein AXX17_AT5G52220 [Arabidopsis thaliana]
MMFGFDLLKQYAGTTEQISTAAEALVGRSTTLTEALKAAAINVGRKPVETTDLAAIKEVEARAIGGDIESDGGVTAVASKAVARNQKIGEDNEKTNLGDVIAEIDVKVTRDREVTSEDAEAVIRAELNHSPFNNIIPGGVVLLNPSLQLINLIAIHAIKKKSKTMGSSKDSASVTNISVEEHFSVSQSSPGGQFVGPTEEISTAAEALIGRSTTLTEALKAASMNVGHKPVETTDVAAIKEVETRAIGGDIESDGGVTAVASKAVARNQKIGKDNEKTNLGDVIAEIDVKVTRDREVTSEDAEAVIRAELNHSPFNNIIPGGVAESVAAAYKLNHDPSSL